MDLKPCPWCKTSEHLSVSRQFATETSWVECFYCGMTGPRSDGLDKVDGECERVKWNGMKVADEDGEFRTKGKGKPNG